FDWDFARLGPAQYLVHQLGGPPEQVRKIGPIEDEAACLGCLSKAGDRRQARLQRQGVNPSAARVREGVDADVERLGTGLDGVECKRDILRSLDFYRGGIEAAGVQACPNLGHLPCCRWIAAI